MGIRWEMIKAIFLDRDGVINEVHIKGGVTHPPQQLADFKFKAGIHQLCSFLRDQGFKLIIVTNQPDVARGLQTKANVDKINQFIQQQLPIDATFVCYHDKEEGCSCRKPEPGLLLEAAEKQGIDLKASFMVGDRWSDVVAGNRAGCRTILLENAWSGKEKCKPDFIITSLNEIEGIVSKEL